MYYKLLVFFFIFVVVDDDVVFKEIGKRACNYHQRGVLQQLVGTCGDPQPNITQSSGNPLEGEEKEL